MYYENIMICKTTKSLNCMHSRWLWYVLPCLLLEEIILSLYNFILTGTMRLKIISLAQSRAGKKKKPHSFLVFKYQCLWKGLMQHLRFSFFSKKLCEMKVNSENLGYLVWLFSTWIRVFRLICSKVVLVVRQFYII